MGTDCFYKISYLYKSMGMTAKSPRSSRSRFSGEPVDFKTNGQYAFDLGA